MKANEAMMKIKNEFDENVNSHVFLVETNDAEKCLDDLKELIANLLSNGDETTRHQIINETYLELIIILSDGKTIKNERILELQDRIKTKPVLSKYVVYIISPAEEMTENSANKLLKTIEEPNENVIGFLVTCNADLLLPTIKSRCEKITMIYDAQSNQEIPEEIRELTKNLIIALENRDHVAFYRAKSSDKLLKENAQMIENSIKNYYNMACNLKDPKNADFELIDYIKKNNDFPTLIKKAKYINTLLNKLTKNMNADLLLEKMFFDLKEVK